MDSLRALAALYVVLGHIRLEVWPRTPPVGLVGALTAPFAYGHQAVSVFIVLSGYSLMTPVARNGYRLPWGVWGFYWRRARRIAPPYYLALALALALIWSCLGRKTGTVWDMTIPVTGPSLLAHLLLVQDLFATRQPVLNYAFWSIALECHIYLAFPALTPLWRRYHPVFALLLVYTLASLLFFALIPTWIGRLPAYGVGNFAPQYLGLFAIGMFAASVTQNAAPLSSFWQRMSQWRIWDALALVSLVALALHVGGQGNLAVIYGLDALTGVMAAGLLLAASRSGRVNPIRAALEWRPLAWIGGFSYSLYLIHAPLIQLLWQYALHPLGLGDTLTYLALLGLGLPLIVAAAWGFWYFCERPFLNTRPNGVRRAERL